MQLFFVMNSRYVPEEFSHYHEYLMSVLFRAPGGFTSLDDSPVDQRAALREAFEVLQEAFPLVERKLKDETLAAVLRELLKMAYEFFTDGDDRNGRYALQEVEGTVWPSRKVPPRHAPDAERRALGKVERYADVSPHPYPYPGKLEDMGYSQLKLFEAVLQAYEGGSDTLPPGKTQYWLLGSDATARRFNARSGKAASARFTQELLMRSALAVLRAENVFGSLLIFDVEELGCPRMSVRGRPEDFEGGTPNFIVEQANWSVEPNG